MVDEVMNSSIAESAACLLMTAAREAIWKVPKTLNVC